MKVCTCMLICVACVLLPFNGVTLRGRQGAEGALTWGNQPVEVGQWGRKPAGLGLLPQSWDDLTLCII